VPKASVAPSIKPPTADVGRATALPLPALVGGRPCSCEAAAVPGAGASVAGVDCIGAAGRAGKDAGGSSGTAAGGSAATGGGVNTGGGPAVTEGGSAVVVVVPPVVPAQCPSGGQLRSAVRGHETPM
jgi:hypothetical protein